ncbi:MAG: RsmF rRNA methyltransferase first C-terminal domain-containing protein [Clostridiales bacterium]|nr:RsmF rRNA methyltransferase first C-terminal domain-containing protein [Clostridiales bacterium]
MRLPAELSARLQGQLGGEGLAAFLSCMEQTPVQGLRLNTLKGPVPELLRLTPFPLTPIPWAPGGFTYAPDVRPAKLHLYQAGIYYLQEPSAMAPAAALDAKPGERVLDLCAAPGGKTTQLASAMAGEGLLVANDNSLKRLKPLIWNLEHWGAVNAVVTNEEPHRLAAAFPGFFHKILIDAPCSGEGMLRKEPRALAGWRKYNGEACREIQDRLLDAAAAMLAPGGRMVYSTCTFNPLENEEAVEAFLGRQQGFRLLPAPIYEGWLQGRVLKDCRQIWPHLAKGEGQFLALMEKTAGAVGSADVLPAGAAGAANAARAAGFADVLPAGAARAAGFARAAGSARGVSPASQPEDPSPFLAFMGESFTRPLEGDFTVTGGHVYRIPPGLPDMAGLKLGRRGWYLGMIRNGRFRPSQPLAMGIRAERMRRRLDLEPFGEHAERYLRGETLMLPGEKGWTLVTLAGFPLGFGRQTGDYLKNEYAGGWRLT